MTADQVKRLEVLLRYLDRWQAAHKKWLRWIDREFRRRLNAYKAFRKQAENKLIDASDLLKFKAGRVDSYTSAGERAKWRFRRACDEIFQAVVMRGHDLFGVEGKRDRAGVFIGRVDKAMGKLAMKALKDSFDGV